MAIVVTEEGVRLEEERRRLASALSFWSSVPESAWPAAAKEHRARLEVVMKRLVELEGKL